MHINRSNIYTLLLLLAHLLIFNFIYVSRYDLNATLQMQSEFNQGKLKGSPWTYLRLYYSHISDETYYYEWSSVALGKSFEANYPVHERGGSPVASYFNEEAKARIPYLELPSEYPPILLLPILAARMISSNFMGFCHALAFILSIFYLASFYLCFQITKALQLKCSLNKLLSLSLLSILLLGQIFVTRLDIMAAFIFILAIYTFLKEYYVWSAIVIAVGFFTKGFSIVLFPFYFLYLAYKKKWRLLFLFSSLFCLTLGLGLGFADYFTQGLYWESFKFHQSRGIQIESFYSLPAHTANLLNFKSIFTYYSHNSANIRGPFHAWILASTQYLPLIFLLTFYFFAILKLKRNDFKNAIQEHHWLLQGSTLLLMIFMISFKVFSPQYLIWLVPLFFISQLNTETLGSKLFLAMLALTQVFYPTLYTIIENAYPIGSFLLLVRNLLFAMLTILLIKSWWKYPKLER